MKVLGQLTDIYIYPIKSIPGIRLEKALITKFGIAHPDNEQIIDRKWMIVDSNGTFKTQRQMPQMAFMKQSVVGDFIILSAPGKDPIKVSVKCTTNKKMTCRVWNLNIEGYAYGGEISKWISDYLETENLDLVVFGNDFEPRKVKNVDELGNQGRENDVVIFEDYSPHMMISENSLIDLNKRLEKKVSMQNFRPTLVAGNCDAYAEDNWESFYIGKTKFTRVKHCTRCLLTTVDPEQGVRYSNQEPLKTLKEYRSNKEIYGVSPMFGVNLAADNFGLYINVGDDITSL